MTSKLDILKEIKRTAKENGGKALGQNSFHKVTGIGQHIWSNFWPRWGDAVREARIKPNKPWERYPDSLLIKKTIAKIRKYGKYPTIYELKVDVNKGDDFPLHIFKKRKQTYIIEKIIDYCKNKTAYNDVIKICKPVIDRLNSKYSDSTGSNISIGEVYLFKSGRYYKIGRANDTVRRGKELRIQLPEEMKLVHSIQTDDPSGVEAYWHKRFDAKRMRGEWFNLNMSDINAFKRWKKII